MNSKPMIPIFVVLLFLFCTGCENKKAIDASLQIVELEERQETLEAEIHAQKIQLVESENEKGQAIRALHESEEKDRMFFEEVRSRLTAIESDFAKSVKLDTAGKALDSRREEFNKSYGGKVAAKVKENEAIQRLLTAENIPHEDWSKVFDRLQREAFEGKNTIAILEKEIESLRKGRKK